MDNMIITKYKNFITTYIFNKFYEVSYEKAKKEKN